MTTEPCTPGPDGEIDFAESFRQQEAAEVVRRRDGLSYKALSGPITHIAWDFVRKDRNGAPVFGPIQEWNTTRSSMKPGAPVRIRPCAPEYGDRTFIGLFIGEVALGVMATRTDPATGHQPSRLDTGTPAAVSATGLVLSRTQFNPAFLVPDIGRVIYGMQSWWGEISSVADLQTISDVDINSVWYVQALQTLQKTETENRA
jgi:hypothetical protein